MFDADDMRRAYIAGATDVHNNWQEDRDPDFTEAAHDYVAMQSARTPTSRTMDEGGEAARSLADEVTFRRAWHTFTVAKQNDLDDFDALKAALEAIASPPPCAEDDVERVDLIVKLSEAAEAHRDASENGTRIYPTPALLMAAEADARASRKMLAEAAAEIKSLRAAIAALGTTEAPKAEKL